MSDKNAVLFFKILTIFNDFLRKYFTVTQIAKKNFIENIELLKN